MSIRSQEIANAPTCRVPPPTTAVVGAALTKYVCDVADKHRRPIAHISKWERRMPKSFKDYEHEGWNKKASQYERVTLPITRQGFEPILTSFGDLSHIKIERE
jgi:hypothetical protein